MQIILKVVNNNSSQSQIILLKSLTHMRTSRTVALIDKGEVIAYPKCNFKKEHEKQSINLVCMTKSCKFYGPICSLCKKEHSGHNVVPIKSFLSSVAESHQKLSINVNKIQEKQEIEQNHTKSTQQKPAKSSLQKMEQIFHQIMGMLKYQVAELAEQIKRTEEKIMGEFEQAKLSLSQENNKAQLIGLCLDFFNRKQFQDIFEYRKYINKVLKIVTINKNDFQIKFQQQQIIRSYEEKAQIYKQNIFMVQQQIKELYSVLNQKFMVQKIQTITEPIRPKTAMPGLSKAENICFSPNFKAPNIVLQKDGKIAKFKDNGGNKFVFFNNTITSKNYEVNIKILNLTGTISLGLGHKQKIKLKGYKFQKTPTGHGAYLIVSNKCKYNASDKLQDGVNTSFNFIVGDEIKITFKAKQRKLIFQVKDDPKRISEINLKNIQEAAIKQLQFCAVLMGMGDRIEII